MRSNKTNYLVAIIILLLVSISIGYAALSSTLNINGTSNIAKTIWDVHFENIVVTAGSVTATSSPTVSGDKLAVNYVVPLTLPGDFYEFTVDVKNSGSISAKLSQAPVISGVNTTQDVYVNYMVTYSSGDEIKSGDTLNAGASTTIKVRIEYDENITAGDLPSEAQTLNLSYSMNYVQQ